MINKCTSKPTKYLAILTPPSDARKVTLLLAIVPEEAFYIASGRWFYISINLRLELIRIRKTRPTI